MCFTNLSPLPKHLSATYYKQITSVVRQKCVFLGVAWSTDTQGGGVGPGHEGAAGCDPV